MTMIQAHNDPFNETWGLFSGGSGSNFDFATFSQMRTINSGKDIVEQIGTGPLSTLRWATQHIGQT